MDEPTAYGPIATHLRFENDHIRVWEMDLAPGAICRLHRHTLDYVLYILQGGRIAVESPGMTSNRFPGQSTYELEVGARAISYVPAGGAESARNISNGPFREVIFEIRRPLPPDASSPGFALTEAADGQPPHYGEAMLLENSRIRALELMLGPGESTPSRLYPRDTAAFVIEGGSVNEREIRDGMERSRTFEAHPGAVMWHPGGWFRALSNTGSSAYRELRIELR